MVGSVIESGKSEPFETRTASKAVSQGEKMIPLKGLPNAIENPFSWL